MIIKPTFDLVAIEPSAPPQQSEVIIRPESAEVPGYGTVIATGPGGWQGPHQVPTGFEPGNKVYFNAKNANTIWIGDKKVVFVRAANIYAKTYADYNDMVLSGAAGMADSEM